MAVPRKPMLANEVKVDTLYDEVDGNGVIIHVGYLNNPEWVAQLKADGQRLVITVDNGVVTAIGRDAQVKNGLSHKLLGQFEAFDVGTWVFDGEIIGGQLHLFDLIHAAPWIISETPFVDRWQALTTLYRELWKPDPAVVSLLPVAVGKVEKANLVTAAIADKREGIMLRHVDGRYQWGKRSDQLLKCKFTKTVDAIVLRIGDEGKDNATLGLIDPEGDGRIVEIGRASAIGKKPKPAIYDVWEVQYLYVVDRDNPRLYQPRLMSKRTDKELSECLFSQLDHAYTDKVIDLTRTRSQM